VDGTVRETPGTRQGGDPTGDPGRPDFDLTDEELRATGNAKWSYPPPDTLPAWVAEMDVRPCPPVHAALREATERFTVGYPAPDRVTGLREATAGFLTERFGWRVDPDLVVGTGDVMAGMRLTLEVLCERAPVVVPVPSYPPFLELPELTGRELVRVPCTRDAAGRPTLDVGRIAAALGDGARTVLLANPHNPLGRAFDPAELGALRDVVDRVGGRVISDEIHAPLVLAGARHLPYAALDGTADHVTTVLAASKAWNVPGLKCAQIVAGTAADARRLRSAPLTANHGTSPLGIVATVAAYTAGGPWLDGVLEHLDRMRELFGTLLADRLPAASWTPPEATYLAWVDASATGALQAADRALAVGRVMVNPGRSFGAADTWFRVNLATSAERLTRVVDRLAAALTAGGAPPRG
jgi:cystathionine beta-lyase